jgi:hypothetical protein
MEKSVGENKNFVGAGRGVKAKHGARRMNVNVLRWREAS